MTTITLNIPDNLNKHEIIRWFNQIINNPELLEDFLLWIKMEEIKDNDNIHDINKLKNKYVGKISQ